MPDPKPKTAEQLVREGRRLRESYLKLLPVPPSGKRYEAPLFSGYEPPAARYFVFLAANASRIFDLLESQEKRIGMLTPFESFFQALGDMARAKRDAPSCRPDEKVHIDALLNQAEKIVEMREVLKWLDARGGLGADAHARIRNAIHPFTPPPTKEPTR